jgi:hypothetical protein
MTADIRDDPEFIEWANHVQNDVVPKMKGSAVTVSLAPAGETDIKFACELGLSIMLDKPIILVCEPGQIIPDKLLNVADKVIEIDWRNNPSAQEQMGEAIYDFVREKGLDK